MADAAARAAEQRVPAQREAEFRQDPLGFLDRHFPAAGDGLWISERHLVVAEPEAARWVLANPEGHYREHSDFFSLSRGVFGPKESQMAIGRASRRMLRAFLDSRRDDLPAWLEHELEVHSHWPDTGNRLIYRFLAPCIVNPDRSGDLHPLLAEVVERSVRAGARREGARWRRAIYGFRVMRGLKRAVRRRRAAGAEPPGDLLDAVVGGAPAEAPAGVLAEVFLSALFAISASIGFTLGWSIALLGRHPEAAAAPADWVVREALRLWPVAWLLARTVERPHALLGQTVAAGTRVVVSPYLVHRNPLHWEEPDAFRPQRWVAGGEQRAYLPFGWGPHTCAAASFSIDLVAEMLDALRARHHLETTPTLGPPHAGPALAPPPFTLHLRPRRRRSANPDRGRTAREGCPLPIP